MSLLRNKRPFAAGIVLLSVTVAGCRSASPTSHGTGLLALTEHDEDGGRTKLHQKIRFVDVNSRFDVTVLKDELRASIADRYRVQGIDTAELELYRDVAQLAANGLSGLPTLEGAAAAYAGDPTDPAVVNALDSALRVVAASARPLSSGILNSASPLSALRPEWNTILGQRLSSVGQYRALFQLVDERASAFTDQVDDILESQAFAVMLEARLLQGSESRNLHLPGFDDYPQGDYYRVDRWRVAPSDKDAAAFEQMSELAASMRRGDTTPKELVRNIARNLVEGVTDRAQACLDKTRADLKALKGRAETYVQAEASAIGQLEQDAADLVAAVKNLRDRYVSGGSAALFSFDTFYGDILGVVDQAKSLTADVDALVNRVTTNGGALANDLKALVDGMTVCASDLRDHIVRRAQDVTNQLGLTSDMRKVVENLGDYGDKVKRHSLTSLPTSTSLDLLRAGPRATGDRLAFRLGVTQVDGETGLVTGAVETVDDRLYELEQVLPHFESAVNLGFANPNGTANVNSEWQTVPSYSLLLKGGSRTNGFYNRALDPGIGLHMAALDFDGDDSPELGVGLVVSIFRDYLQAGYGYDITEDRFYAFFGLGVPLSALGDSLNGGQ